MKTLKCVEMGNANCNAVFKALTVDEVINQASEHAKTIHSVVATPEMVEKMKGLVKDETAPAATPQATAKPAESKPATAVPASTPTADKPAESKPAATTSAPLPTMAKPAESKPAPASPASAPSS